MYSHLPEILWEGFRGGTLLSDPIFFSVPTSAPPPHLEEDTQMDGGSDYHPALKLLQDTNQVIAQLEYELVQETQELVERYEHKWAKQARRHAKQWAQVIDQIDATFQGIFLQVSSTEAVMLLPWCIFVAVPFCYTSGPVTIDAQWDESISTISEPSPTACEPEPEPHGSPVTGPSGGLTPPPGTPLLPVSSLPDIPLVGTSMVGCPFLTS